MESWSKNNFQLFQFENIMNWLTDTLHNRLKTSCSELKCMILATMILVYIYSKSPVTSSSMFSINSKIHEMRLISLGKKKKIQNPNTWLNKLPSVRFQLGPMAVTKNTWSKIRLCCYYLWRKIFNLQSNALRGKTLRIDLAKKISLIDSARLRSQCPAPPADHSPVQYRQPFTPTGNLSRRVTRIFHLYAFSYAYSTFNNITLCIIESFFFQFVCTFARTCIATQPSTIFFIFHFFFIHPWSCEIMLSIEKTTCIIRKKLPYTHVCPFIFYA